jgi:hypothetical protein
VSNHDEMSTRLESCCSIAAVVLAAPAQAVEFKGNFARACPVALLCNS